MTRRNALLIALGALSLGAVPWLSGRAVDALAARAVAALAAFASLTPACATEPPPVPPAPAPDALPAPPASAERSPGPARGPHTAKPPAPSRGILVRRNVVQAAVRRGIRPSASPVAAAPGRPAGLVVTGWGAAGAGFVDGDIITSVGGRTPQSIDDVIAAVAGAYKAESYAVSGRVWRNGETFAATVELPIPGNNQAKPKSPKKPGRHSVASRSTGGP